jgi:hypothetical protein
MEQQPLIALSHEDLYEYVADEVKENYEIFIAVMNELHDTGFVELLQCSDDVFLTKARTDIKWSDVMLLPDQIKRKIMLQLVQNPKTFFVLHNTQKGKLRIIGKEIASWGLLPQKKVVSYLVVANDRTLSEQSVNGLFSCFPLKPDHESREEEDKYNVRIFELSSNNKTSLKEILLYIDAYASDYSDNAPPLIIVLANHKQMEKLIQILHHVVHHRCPNLYAGGGWDEADETYPRYREKAFQIKHETVNFISLLNHPSERIIRNGFVTATEGNLLDEEDYEECANAHHYQSEIDPIDQKNYMSFHHPESKKHIIRVAPRESNNVIAARVLNDNWDTHFSQPLQLQDGSPYHHKIIINADTKSDEMAKFARSFRDRAHVITFNMYGVKLYNTSFPDGKLYSVRKWNLNKLLFYIYKMNHLESKPMIIIGRRKVDRGLGFHYAPRASGLLVITIKYIHDDSKIGYKEGVLHTDGREGLIWTDMCMGNKIEHIPTSVQKAGRGAGIIRQCPQYPGEFHYWVEDETARNIEHHYHKVDAVNALTGYNSISRAMMRANESVQLVQRNHNVNMDTFRVLRGSSPAETLQLIKNIITNIFHETYRVPHQDASRKYKTSLNNTSATVNILDAINKVPSAYGTNNGKVTYRRFLACYLHEADENSLHCVIPLIDPKYTPEMIIELDASYREYMVHIPKEGQF